MKKRDFKEAMKPMTRKGCAVCSDCPKWIPSYCPITCATRIATHPACRYGADLINSRETSRRAKRKNDRTEPGNGKQPSVSDANERKTR